MTNLLPLIHAEIAWPLRYPRIPAELTPEMTFDELGLSPVDRVCLQMSLDEALGIEIPCRDAEAWETIGDVVASVGRLVGEPA